MQRRAQKGRGDSKPSRPKEPPRPDLSQEKVLRRRRTAWLFSDVKPSMALIVGAIGVVACARSKPLYLAADGGAGSEQGGAAGAAFGGSQAFGGTAGSGGSTGGSGGTASSSACVPSTPDGQCGLSPLCGCESGDNCVVADTATGKTTCIQGGTIAEKHACLGSGTCAVGMECIGGACARYCSKHEDCGADALCAETVADAGPVPGLRTCTAACALDDPSSCAPGIGCFLLDSGVTDCRPAGTSTSGCSDVQDCAPGYTCLSDGQCVRWCRADAPACPGGTSCYTGSPAIIVSGVVYGACL